MIRILCFFLVFCDVSAFQKEENSEWQLAKYKYEISVYTRKVGYSDYKEFKGELVVKSSPEKVVELLRNIDKYTDWLPDCLESKKLNRSNGETQINYILTDVPWPFEDRDIIYEFRVLPKEKDTGQFQILIENNPDYIAHKKGIVRIPSSKGLWIIIPVSENKTKLVYQMHIEPGGYVPAWLANLKITDTPYTFLNNLRKQLEN